MAALAPGEDAVYSGGCITHFQRLTRWASPGKVLYIGDHLASDLAVPAKRHGWRTLMVLDELSEEVPPLPLPPPPAANGGSAGGALMCRLVVDQPDVQNCIPDRARQAHLGTTRQPSALTHWPAALAQPELGGTIGR